MSLSLRNQRECDCDLTEVYFIAPQESKIKEKITYCEACGQAIDWSDEE